VVKIKHNKTQCFCAASLLDDSFPASRKDAAQKPNNDTAITITDFKKYFHRRHHIK